MVLFEEKLAKEAWPEWRQQYIDYNMLKRKLDEVVEAKQAGSEDLVSARRHIFQGMLDEQLSQALDFYKSKATAVTAEVHDTLARISTDMQGTLNDAHEKVKRLDRAIHQLQNLAEQNTHLLEFVSLNLAAVRKILKKLKKHVEPLAPVPGFLSLEIQHPHDPSFKLSEGTFLPESKAADLEAMSKHVELTQCADDIRNLYYTLRDQRRDLMAAASDEERRHMHTTASDNALHDLEDRLQDLRDAEALSRRNAALVHTLHWAEVQAGILEKPPPEEDAVATTLGLALVCAASALYMANYQLCLPTVTTFCLHLGVPASYAGIVVGATDIATIPMTVGYSLWSNRSFKQPFLFAAFACVLSNLFYCISYDWGGFALLSVARCMTGLGSSRSVSRRYIADFTPRSKRMQASTAFVCSSAIGMALGPLLSFPLQQLPDTLWHGIRINSITAAGYVMIALWLVFVVIVQCFFTDPLQVLRERDAARLGGVAQPLLQESRRDSAISRMEAALPQGAPNKAEAHSKLDEQQLQARRELWASLPPTFVAIAFLWINKAVQQGYMDGLSIFTSAFFGWTSGDVGLLLTALGLSALPVSAAVGIMSSWIPDGVIVTWTVIFSCLGCLGVALHCDQAWTYFGGGSLIFLGTLVMEGASMSLLSKVIHPRFQHGLFNAGLIATEAGTIGRFTGNALISIVGSFTGSSLKDFAHVLYILFIAMMAVLQCALFALWSKFLV